MTYRTRSLDTGNISYDTECQDRLKPKNAEENYMDAGKFIQGCNFAGNSQRQIFTNVVMVFMML